MFTIAGRRFSPPIPPPFLGKLASACRHGEFIERTGSKTIANVRTVDECVKRMNGVFSLENTESEYMKGDNLPGKPARKYNFGSKFYKPFLV